MRLPAEILRFAVVGTLATLLQYAVYWLLVALAPAGCSAGRLQLWASVAMTVGYVVSFIFNFFATTRYTFRVSPTARRGAGFALSHAVNYGLQMLLLNLFLAVGVGRQWAPLPVFAVCVPVNFLLVRFFMKKP